jgi:hypothetical protein
MFPSRYSPNLFPDNNRVTLRITFLSIEHCIVFRVHYLFHNVLRLEKNYICVGEEKNSMV